MVHLNREHLTAAQLDKLFNQLNSILGTLSATDANLFLSELLGQEERIMLAKRLAAIILLVEGKSLYKIADILKLSSSTAKQLKVKLNHGEYHHLIKMLGQNKKNYFVLLETLDNILHLGGILPHYNGLDRYKMIR